MLGGVRKRKMREIKFRAWDRTSDIMRTDISSIDYDGSGKVAQINVVTGADILFPDKEAILMQYTGLKDKNGVEIYEGDIVALSEEYDEDRSYAIEWQINGYWLDGWDGNEYGFPDEDTLEVIGNVYENPELLKIT